MSTAYSIAQRTPLLNSLFAGIACAATLALTAGPALAQPGELERVEISGRVYEAPTRYDIRAACTDIDVQLQEALQGTWERERRTGEVRVQLVLNDGDIASVTTQGMSNTIKRSVRQAVNRLDCGTQRASGAQVYRFVVDFFDPEDRRFERLASAKSGVRLALARE